MAWPPSLMSTTTRFPGATSAATRAVPGEGERLVLGDSVPNPDDDARFRRQDRSTVAMPAPIFGWIPGKETTILSQSYPVYRKALRNGHVAK